MLCIHTRSKNDRFGDGRGGRFSARRAALAVGLAVAAGSAGAAAATPSSAAAAAPPAGFTVVTDDTGTVSAALADEWLVTTQPEPDGNGTFFPTIVTSTGTTPPMCDECGWGLDLPSITITARPPGTVTQPSVEGCGDIDGPDPVDNGYFRGNVYEVAGCDALFLEAYLTGVDGLLDVTVTMVYWSVGEGFDPPDPDDPLFARFDSVVDSLTPHAGYPAAISPPADDTPEPRPVGNTTTTPGPTLAGGTAAFPYGDVRAVPQLGDEPVRGSGCGSEGQIGDTIPDGTWAGFVGVNGGAATIDLLCVFLPDAVAGVGETANVVNDDPAFFVVNNNERLRVAATGAGMQLHDGVPGAAGACTPGEATRDHAEVDRTTLAWVTISGGLVTSVVWDCRPLSSQ